MFSASVLSEANLWLPPRYKEHLPQLEEAAAKVAGTERCQKVVRGELLESKSTTGKPVFRIICRDEKVKTYVTLIDGVTFDELHASGETRLEQKRRHLPNYSRLCLDQLKQRAKRMNSPEFPASAELQPSLLSRDEVEFEVDFAARGQGGADLEYRGYCQFKSIAEYKVTIKPRPKAN